MTKLCNVNLHSNFKMSLYADDTAIFIYGKPVKEVHNNIYKIILIQYANGLTLIICIYTH